jgi:hypothetical protein
MKSSYNFGKYLYIVARAIGSLKKKFLTSINLSCQKISLSGLLYSAADCLNFPVDSNLDLANS